MLRGWRSDISRGRRSTSRSLRTRTGRTPRRRPWRWSPFRLAVAGGWSSSVLGSARGRWARRLSAAVLVAGLSGTALAAPAEGGNVEGTVLSLEGSDVIVDLGGAKGVAEGDLLELWRSIELVHPVTRKPVRD